MTDQLPILVAVALNVLALGLLIVFLSRNIIRVPPNEVAVITGRRRIVRDPVSGAFETAGYRTLSGGSAFRIPVLERVDRLPLSEISIQLEMTDLRNASGRKRSLSLLVNCAIVAEYPFVSKAIVRFLGMELAAIEAILRTTIEGRISNGMLETDLDVDTTWPAFQQRMEQAVREDLAAIGVRVDNFVMRGMPFADGHSGSGDGARNLAVE